MTLRTIARRFKRALTRRDPLITVSISKEALLHNLHTYQNAYPNLQVAPVLKSNAYGHGLALIAEVFDREKIAFFMVDSLFEARKLRRAGIRSRIVVMGYVRPEQMTRKSLSDTDYAIVDIEQLREVAREAVRPLRIHIKLDTGMHRQGILPLDLPEAMELIKQSSHLSLVGVATHLADADNEDIAFSEKQLSVWDECVKTLTAAFPSIEYFHAAATKGALFSKNHPMNVVRVGMGLYGCDTSFTHDLPVKTALSLHAPIVSIREIPQGESVGYGATFTATRPSRIATVPAGYYEGVNRRLSNVGTVLVEGVQCPIAGRVSMNMCSIDITDAPKATRGSMVTLISANKEDPNSITNIAKLSETTPYVILAHIPEHLYRRLD